jgi:hypothetical protein
VPSAGYSHDAAPGAAFHEALETIVHDPELVLKIKVDPHCAATLLSV